MTSKTCGCTIASCGCCAGTQQLTPASVANRPGLAALAYRAGTHGSFLETMKARLATMSVEAPGADGQTFETFYPLRGLTTRDSGDSAIALLDAWATVGDVLTFYQERIANEGYLRTATERRSILELARLMGYTLRPGVASSVYLAYTIDENQTVPVEIPAGSRAQSIPGPDELPQSFETSEPLPARAEWNNLQPRLTQPQKITESAGVLSTDIIYLQGTTTNLKANDPLLFEIGAAQILRFVKTVEADFVARRTKIALQPAPSVVHPLGATPSVVDVALASSLAGVAATAKATTPLGILNTLTRSLSKPLTRQHAGSAFLPRSLGNTLDPQKDGLPQLLTVFKPEVASTIYPAWANTSVPDPHTIRIHAFRVKASPFGSNAPLRPVTDAEGKVVAHQEWPIAGMAEIRIKFPNNSEEGDSALITITRDGRPQRATFQLGRAGEFTIDEFAGERVKVTAEATNVEFPPIASYRFAFEALNTAIVIQPLFGDSQLVSIAEVDKTGEELAVSPAKTIEYSTGIHQATISLPRNAFALTVDVLVPSPPDPNVIFLDAQYDQILAGDQSWTAIVWSDDHAPLMTRILGAGSTARTAYGISGKSTRLTLEKPWWAAGNSLFLSLLRGATVFAQSEDLALAERPYHADVNDQPEDVASDRIELGRLYNGLQTGRWIIVSGERTDVKDANDVIVRGVRASELVMLAGVEQAYDENLPGDKVHTTIVLAKALAYTYKRDTVTISSNVIKATHGEARSETLGSGDGSQALQTFVLKQPPVTFVSSAAPEGTESTLKVYVNDVEWHETKSLAGLQSQDRCFVTKTDDEAKTAVIFGNGGNGARLPTGLENVKAVYRSGIGKPGNVRPEQISLLQSRPFGVKSVINPLRASGGADKESRDQARENTPLAVMALDRLVSLQDYRDFARGFAGIGKADAQRLSDGNRELIHLTIAGADDIPIDAQSDLYRNLLTALRMQGDPDLPVHIATRELLILVLSAGVRIAPDYQWTPVATAIRAALLKEFGFAKRFLGQPVFLSEVVSVMQQQEGVAYVDVDAFGSVSEETVAAGGVVIPPDPQSRVDAKRAHPITNGLRPAQLAIFSPAVPDTLILNPLK